MLIIRSAGWHYRPLQVTPPNYYLLRSTAAGQETPQGIFKSAQLDNVVLNIIVSPLGVFSICSGPFDQITQSSSADSFFNISFKAL